MWVWALAVVLAVAWVWVWGGWPGAQEACLTAAGNSHSASIELPSPLASMAQARGCG